MTPLEQKPNFVLDYFAPMQCSNAERAELVRRRTDGVFIEWDGRVFIRTDQFIEDEFPRSRRGAKRNRKKVFYPIYRCEKTGETITMMNEKYFILPGNQPSAGQHR